MARLEGLLYGVGLLVVALGRTDAFYLPGGAPNSFSKDEKVRYPPLNNIVVEPSRPLLPRRAVLSVGPSALINTYAADSVCDSHNRIRGPRTPRSFAEDAQMFVLKPYEYDIVISHPCWAGTSGSMETNR